MCDIMLNNSQKLQIDLIPRKIIINHWKYELLHWKMAYMAFEVKYNNSNFCSYLSWKADFWGAYTLTWILYAVKFLNRSEFYKYRKCWFKIDITAIRIKWNVRDRQVFVVKIANYEMTRNYVYFTARTLIF